MKTLKNLIPEDLNMSTADRLRLVADIIEAYPKRWDQMTYTSILDGYDDEESPTNVYVDDVHDCNTTFCVAGWGTLLTPPDVIALHLQELQDEDRDAYYFTHLTATEEWDFGGTLAFCFDDDLATTVFNNMTNDPTEMARLLRNLADLPEPRTLKAARAAGVFDK